MDHNDIEDTLRRYAPLDLAVRNAAASFCMANPGLRLEVTLSGRLADAAFRRRRCFSADGEAVVLVGKDGGLEARQAERLYAFSGDGILLGVHRWDAGEPGTPGALLASGRFPRAVDYAVLTHREWFEAGAVPCGLPEAGSAYANTLHAELEITIFGGTHMPSPWSAGGAGRNEKESGP
jgi:hypothetical protein